MSDLADRLRKAKGLDLELKQEAADELDRLNELREQDGRAMGLLIEGYNKMKTLCVDGKYLTDEEREAVNDAIYLCGATAGLAEEQGNATAWATCAATLRSLLERMSPQHGSR
jgi:hypothetical protein